MTISEVERKALLYAARDRDFIAVVGLSTHIEPLQLDSGKWRAYLSDFVTPWSPSGQTAESKEVVRDNYGYIISGATKVALIEKLKAEYPNWKWRSTYRGRNEQ